MNSKLERDKNRLQIFHEGRKRRIFVGELKYIEKKDYYELSYDKNYVALKNAIPISPDLTLFKIKHISQKGKLFPAFTDRIPLRTNPAYADYCFAQNISADETNPIILLGSIGKKGPSSFIFEPVYEDKFTSIDLIKIRENLDISQHDFAEAFGLSKATLQRIEAGTSKDANTLKLIQIFFTFPECGIWQLQLTGSRVHSEVSLKLRKYFLNGFKGI